MCREEFNEKNNLMKLQQKVVYAIKRQNALELFLAGETNAKKVAEYAGILEIDAISIKKE